MHNEILTSLYIAIVFSTYVDSLCIASRMHSFLPRDALLSAVYAVVVCLSVCVCVCVCHTPVLYQNG